MAGNNYLADYALQFNSQVKVVPTTIDLNYHQTYPQPPKKITIGWTGSSTTLKYFEDLLPALCIIKKKYKDEVDFKIIVDTDIYYPTIEAHTTLWNIETEIEELNKIDIGIMPLPDNQWTRGKCGFKGLQYMSLGIPTIMSPVGVNKDIIADGENGYLANSTDEWVNKLSLLIESVELRKKIGESGKNTIVKKYSVDANKQLYLNCFNSVLESGN